MRQLATVVFIIIFCAGCGMQSGEKRDHETLDSLADKASAVSVIDVGFPLRLGEVDLDGAVAYDVEDHVEARIRQTVSDYPSSSHVDSLYSPGEMYVGTLRLRDSVCTVFLVLLRNYPTNMVDSRILLYDNGTRTFVGDAVDFKIYALYDFDEGGRIRPSHLKEILKIDTPELEKVDYNHDGRMDYRATRLYHNGTFNAIHTCVLSAKGGRIDTLRFDEKPFVDTE